MNESTNPTTDAADPAQEPEAAPSRRRWPLVVGVSAVVIVALVGVGLWWFFFRDDSPDRADIDVARQTLENDREEAAGDAGVGGVDLDVDGTWTVDTGIGSFDYAADDFSGTWAGYRIQEELATIGGATAVGRTPDVTGTVLIDGDQVVEAAFEVDMTSLESDETFRDNRLREQGLETDAFPTASFELTEPVDLPADAASGDTLSYDVTGDLTLHGVTREAVLELDAFLDGEAIVLVASAPIVLDDYDIEKPSAPSVLGISDEGEFELQVFLTRA